MVHTFEFAISYNNIYFIVTISRYSPQNRVGRENLVLKQCSTFHPKPRCCLLSDETQRCSLSCQSKEMSLNHCPEYKSNSQPSLRSSTMPLWSKLHTTNILSYIYIYTYIVLLFHLPSSHEGRKLLI